MRDHFIMFAKYNRWANAKLYAAVAELHDDDYRKDCSVFFKSMHGTLNHLLVGDLIWMSRFESTENVPDSLDVVLHEQFETLLKARRKLDERIISFAENCTDNLLNGEFSYAPVTSPELVTQNLGPALAHFFNHQTHHRGQAHAILTRLSNYAPSLDLIYYQREIRPETAR